MKDQQSPPVKLKVNDGVAELTYRTGEAAPIVEPEVINISGDIKSVATFLKKRFTQAAGEGLQTVNDKRAIVIVDKDRLIIELQLDPENCYGASVHGTLERATELLPFGINTGNILTRDQFIKLLKFNRIYFANYDHHTEVLGSLQKLSSSVQYNVKDESDDRANKDSQFLRTVTTNVPKGFSLTIPIFKGFDAETINVDICIGVKNGTLEFWLESVALAELSKTLVDKIFNEQLEAAEGLVVIFK